MKIPRFPLILTITLVVGLLLSACSGAAIINTWPGLSAEDNTIYLAYQTGVFAVDANNGNMLWRFPAQADGGKSFYAAPVKADSAIIVGDYSNTIYSLNPSSGAQIWEFQREQGHFVASPQVINDTILAPSSDNNLYALDKNGRLRWSFKTNNVLWAQPVSDGQLVYLPAMDHNLYALRLSDGSKVWSADLGGSMLNAPVLMDRVLYIDTLDGQVYAVSAQDGKVLWNITTGEKIWSSPVIHENILYFGTSEGNLYALSTVANVSANNRVLWKVAIGSPVIGAGVVVPKGLVFTTEGGDVQAVSFTGETLWTQKVNGKLYTTPVLVNDTLVVAATEGDALLTAYNLDGGQKWIFTIPK
jgi:outer membrane protein assembly factor BamB